MDRPVFLQYLNPEILALYGVRDDSDGGRVYRAVLMLTKYALLVSEGCLIIPASYLFEVSFIPALLRSIGICRSANLLHFASPSPDLYQYAVGKRREYREEPWRFPAYCDAEHIASLARRPLLWIPRVEHATADDISQEWVADVHDPHGLWRHVLETTARNGHKSLRVTERRLEQVPQRLHGKAFIYRFTRPLLPLGIDSMTETQLAMFLSRAYLESYLAEYNAVILVDTPLGGLDCQIRHLGRPGRPLTISFRLVRHLLQVMEAQELVERVLTWNDLLSVRHDPTACEILATYLALEHAAPGYFTHVLARARYRPLKPTKNSKPSTEYRNRMYHIYETVAPFLETPDGPYCETPRVPPGTFGLLKRRLSYKETRITMNKNDVFLVYGRDRRASEGMKDLLRAVGIVPIEWEEAVAWTGKPSPFILEVIQAAFDRAQAAVVLLTPDEDASLHETLQLGSDTVFDRGGAQPRPNVLIEAGMALALYPNRTLLVEIGVVRVPSDLQGLHLIKFDGSPVSRNTFVNRLKTAGCAPRTAGGGHLTAGFQYLTMP